MAYINLLTITDKLELIIYQWKKVDRRTPVSYTHMKLIPKPQSDISISVVQWLIKWMNRPNEVASWEDFAFIRKFFFNTFTFQDKSGLHRGDYQTPSSLRPIWSTFNQHMSCSCVSDSSPTLRSPFYGWHCFLLLRGKLLYMGCWSSIRRMYVAGVSLVFSNAF